MRLEVGGQTYAGRALDLDADTGLSPAALARAVREGAPWLDCSDPGPAHDHVGVVRPDMALDRRGALAAAARSRGHESAVRAEIRDLRERLSALSVPDVDTEPARRRAAEAGEAEARLRERVAELRGRIDALEEAGRQTEDTRADLADAVERLSEAETERIAARQRLARLEARARDARDRRERRLELEDRLANRQRTARRRLAASVYDEFAGALSAVPGAGRAGDAPGEYEGDPVTAALAVARLADVRAPVILAVGRFESAAAAAEVLEAPVIRP